MNQTNDPRPLVERIHAILHEFQGTTHRDPDGWCDARDHAEAIASLAAAEPAPMGTRWIAAETRPESDETVLVWDGRLVQTGVWFAHGDKWCICGFNDFHANELPITHWTPLPASPSAAGGVTGVEPPSVASERAALVAEVGDCCLGADPACAGGCLMAKACRKRAAAAEQRENEAIARLREGAAAYRAAAEQPRTVGPNLEPVGWWAVEHQAKDGKWYTEDVRPSERGARQLADVFRLLPIQGNDLCRVVPLYRAEGSPVQREWVDTCDAVGCGEPATQDVVFDGQVAYRVCDRDHAAPVAEPRTPEPTTRFCNKCGYAGTDRVHYRAGTTFTVCNYDAAPLPAEPERSQRETFQEDVGKWVLECFGEQIAKDTEERCYRFLEESLELVQSIGCSHESAHKLVDYVYSRGKGETFQELGGVMVTIAALSVAIQHSMQTAGEVELARCWNKMDKIREKHFSKPSFSPLPGPVCSRCRSPEHHVSDCPE